MATALDPHPLANVGVNCWTSLRAHRAAVLIDACAYYRALRIAILGAQRSIHVVGWDFDTRVELLRDDVPNDGAPVRLGELLNFVVSRRKDLHAYVQIWDFATIFALEREPLLLFKLGWKAHRRFHFRYDSRHPFGASHHQKIVVIDDAIAFSGGLDVTSRRWDTPRHEPEDPRRTDPGGNLFPPFHDVQLAVDGDAAAALGDLARDRWSRVSRRRAVVPEKHHRERNAWPADLTPDFRDAHVLIARTEPPFARRPEAREVERLFLDSVACARDTIYVENQYFTSPLLAEALARRLAEPDGPQVVLVLRHSCAGWLEESAMGLRRRRVLDMLSAADLHDRLRIVSPVVDGQHVNVHSKVMIIDDTFLRVGSANLTNRSLGFDTECDLAIEAFDGEQRRSVANVRDRLLAEHLHTDPESVARAMVEQGSLKGAVDALAGGARTLCPLESDGDPPPEAIVTLLELGDPERPLAATRLVESFLPEIRAESRFRNWAFPLAVGLFCATVLAWLLGATTLPRGSFPADDVIRALERLPAWTVPLWFMTASLVLVPLPLLFVLTGVVYGTGAGLAHAAVGALLGTAVGWLLGRAAGRDMVRHVAGSRANALARKLARVKDSITSMAVVRVLPIAPAGIVNLVCGASRVRLSTMLAGSMLGLAPTWLLLTPFGGLLRRLLEQRAVLDMLLLAGVGALALACVVALGRHLRDHIPPVPTLSAGER